MTDTQRADSNPLALAVLVLLYERPMHPYEMAATMRERHKEASIRINYGALYPMIKRLLQKKLIGVRETVKHGKLPEKTVYELTSAGEKEMTDWMRELVSSPVKEYPQFEAAMSLLPALPPEEVIDLLEIRIGLIEKTIKQIADDERTCQEMKLPRLFTLENEYYKALTLAEYKFAKDLLSDLKRDTGGLRSDWSKLRKQLAAAEGRGQQSTKAPTANADAFAKDATAWSKKHMNRVARRWVPKP